MATNTITKETIYALYVQIVTPKQKPSVVRMHPLRVVREWQPVNLKLKIKCVVGVGGIEPTVWRLQRPQPFHLATPHL